MNLKTLLPPPPPDTRYSEWVERTEPFIWTKPRQLAAQPLISIVVPVYNPAARYLLPMVYSVVNQESYDNWELVLVNSSTKKKIKRLANDCASIDNRIKVIDVEENRGIAGNTNLGIAHSTGEYVGLLDHDDMLSPHALYEVACRLQGEDGERPQLIYSDEDKTTENGEHRFDAHFKPEWSPRLLRQVNYFNHFTVIEKKLVQKVGGYRAGFEGAQDYDLFLRLVDEKPRIAHVPKILYHWRAAHNSTAQDFSTKKNILKAGKRALEGHLKRNGQKGRVSYLADQPGFYNISYAPRKTTKVAILLLPATDIKQYTYFVNHLIASLDKTSVPTDVFTGETIEKLTTNNRQIVLETIDAESKAGFIETALAKTKAETLILFNTAAVPRSKNWVEELSGLLNQVESVGVVSPILVDPGGDIIRDAGFVRHDGIAIGLFQGMALKAHTYFGNTVWSRNVDYLSGRLCAFRRSTFEEYFQKQAFYDRDNLYDAEPFRRLLEDGLEAVVFTKVVADYYGELSPVSYRAPFFSPNLSVVRYEPGLVRTINVPPEIKDER